MENSSLDTQQSGVNITRLLITSALLLINVNHSNETSSNILRVKLLCVINSTFSANYQYLSFKYGLTEADWYFNIDHLMGKIGKNVYTVSKAYVM